MVRVRCLQRASVPADVLLSPSPASFHSNRLALHASSNKTCCVYFASGTNIYEAKFGLDGEKVFRGKDSLVIPMDSQMMEIDQLKFTPHRAEIQSVAISEPPCNDKILLGTVDSCGRIVVSAVGASGKGLTFSACPLDGGVGEGGWAGLTFMPLQSSLIAVARGLAKTIDLYDKDLHVRSMHTLQHPTAMAFLHRCTSSDSMFSLLAVTEGPQISLWDLRAGENGGCVQRVLGSNTMDPLYAVCSSMDGRLVGMGGAERTALVFDRRKWTALSRWTGCLKYEITGMSFSGVDQSALYVHGLDYEVVCGRWNNGLAEIERQHFAFRGDSRWLGLSKASSQSIDSDMIGGWCESGSMFVGEAVS